MWWSDHILTSTHNSVIFISEYWDTAQEEYLADLEARNCTVEAGRTNVVSHTRLIFACGDWLQRLRWLDGMPVVFSLPLQHSPAAGDFLVRLSDGREVELLNYLDINIL